MMCLTDFLAKKSQSKLTVVGDRVIDIKQYYLSLYRMYMVKLYDLCYISDPTVYREKEIYNIIAEMGITKLTDRWGITHLTKEYISFGLDWYKKNQPKEEEILEFLEILLNVVVNREIWQDVDKLWEWGGMNPMLKKRLQLRAVSDKGKVRTTQVFGMNEGTIKCYYGFEQGFEHISNHPIIFKYAIQELDNHYKLVSKFSQELTTKHLPLILSGDLELDGEDAEYFEEWLRKCEQEAQEVGYQIEGLYNWVYLRRYDDVIKDMDALLNRLIKDGKDVVHADEHGFWVKADHDVEFPVGQFAFICNEIERVSTNNVQRYYGYSKFYSEYVEEQLPDMNCLLGYTGQVYPIEYLEQNSLYYVGAPIRLYNEYGEICDYIDFEQTELTESDTVFKTVGATLDFDEKADRLELEVDGKLNRFEQKIMELYATKDRGVFSTVFKPTAVKKDVFSLANVRKLCSKVVLEDEEDAIDDEDGDES